MADLLRHTSLDMLDGAPNVSDSACRPSSEFHTLCTSHYLLSEKTDRATDRRLSGLRPDFKMSRFRMSEVKPQFHKYSCLRRIH